MWHDSPYRYTGGAAAARHRTNRLFHGLPPGRRPPGPIPDPALATRSTASESSRESHPPRARAPVRDVHVAGSVDVVGRVDEILDVDLEAQLAGESDERRRVHARVARHGHGVVDAREHVRPIEDAEGRSHA